MAKMMPGRIRNEGIALYEDGKISIQESKNQLIYARIADAELRYGLDDDAISCSCDFFQKKGYCAHLAGLEYYLKNDATGKELLDKLESQEEALQEQERQDSVSSLFLDALLVGENEKTARYSLQVVGSEEAYGGQFIWTLRLRRRPSDRSYVVRDILSFIHTIQKQGYYSIGKSYYEPIGLADFDHASQELLTFLMGLLKNEEGKEVPFFLTQQYRYLYFPASLFEEAVGYLQDLERFELQDRLVSYSQVLFQDLHKDSPLFKVKVEESQGGYRLYWLERNYKPLYDDEFLFYKGTFYQLSFEQRRILKKMRHLPVQEEGKRYLRFYPQQRSRLAASLLQLAAIARVRIPDSLRIHDFQARFDFYLEESQQVGLDMVFDYGSHFVEDRSEIDQLPFASDYSKEEKIFHLLKESGFLPAFKSHRLPLKPLEIPGFFRRTLADFRKLGMVDVDPSLQALYRMERPEIQMSLQGGLLDIEFDFSDIPESDINQVQEALWRQEEYFVSESGQLYIFDQETLDFRKKLADLGVERNEEGHLQTNRLAAFRLNQMLEERHDFILSQDLKQLTHDLQHPEEFPLGKVNVKAELRDYQELGVRWLSMLSHYHFGGVLADDMGLGKTLQTIAFLSSHLAKGDKALVLAPSSLIYNWRKEFEKFAPQIDVQVIYGAKPLRDQLITEDHQVYITSYAAFRQDIEAYQNLDLSYLMLDEAQVMKNSQTKIAKAVRSLVVPHIFALSGTPIENHLREIWSIFDLVLPGLLPSQNQFLKMSPEEVARFIHPFILRRKKEDVLLELPDLTETVYYNQLTDEQKVVYLAQLQGMQERVRGASDEEIGRSQIEILSGLMRLRQICDTPQLFMEDYEGDSGKMESLRLLLEQIQEGNHRVLIFSQFRGMLDLIEEELNQMDMESFKITGSTPAKDRQVMTDSFNQGQGQAFLISLKAGGVGLNLTGADTVILVDLWWNPAVEAQAISRAHRMGQKENVEVYRLISEGTIEEKILELQENKKHLISTVLDGSDTGGGLSADEIRQILGL